MRARSGPTTRCRAPQRPPGAPHHPASSRIARVARASARRRDRFGVAGRAGAAAAYGRGCRSRSALSPRRVRSGRTCPGRPLVPGSAPRPRDHEAVSRLGHVGVARRFGLVAPAAPAVRRSSVVRWAPARVRHLRTRGTPVRADCARSRDGASPCRSVRMPMRSLVPGPPRGSGRGVPSGCLRAPARPVAVDGADDRAPRSGGRNAPGNSPLRGRRRLRAPERVPLRFPADPVRLSRSDPLRFGSARVDGPDRPGPGSWIGRGMPCAKAGRRAGARLLFSRAFGRLRCAPPGRAQAVPLECAARGRLRGVESRRRADGAGPSADRRVRRCPEIRSGSGAGFVIVSVFAAPFGIRSLPIRCPSAARPRPPWAAVERSSTGFADASGNLFIQIFTRMGCMWCDSGHVNWA